MLERGETQILAYVQGKLINTNKGVYYGKMSNAVMYGISQKKKVCWIN
jgi:hypothetical protein